MSPTPQLDPSYLPGRANEHPTSNVRFLGCTQVCSQTAFRSVKPFCTATVVTTIQTHHATLSVAIGRIYVTHAMRP